MVSKEKRAASEIVGSIQKKIKLEEDNQIASIETSTNVAGLFTPFQKKKCQSEPPSMKKWTKTPSSFAIKNSRSSRPANFRCSPFRGSNVLRRALSSRSVSSHSRSTTLPSSSSDAASQSGGSTYRMNNVAKSLQEFNLKRAASAPALTSTASQQGSTPTVNYMGPPNQLVRSAIQQQRPPAQPSASSNGDNSRSGASANNNRDQAGPSILMRIEWASIDNPFLCGGHPILLQGKGTIPEMMNTIKTQVTRFENSLKKKLAKGN